MESISLSKKWRLAGKPGTFKEFVESYNVEKQKRVPAKEQFQNATGPIGIVKDETPMDAFITDAEVSAAQITDYAPPPKVFPTNTGAQDNPKVMPQIGQLETPRSIESSNSSNTGALAYLMANKKQCGLLFTVGVLIGVASVMAYKNN